MRPQVGQRWLFESAFGNNRYLAEVICSSPLAIQILQVDYTYDPSGYYPGVIMLGKSYGMTLTEDGPIPGALTGKILWSYLEGQDKP